MTIGKRMTRLSVRLQAMMRTFERNHLQDRFSDWPQQRHGSRDDVIASVRGRLRTLLRQESQ